ncbi:SMI1/KNR4 family protein [Sorangium sp. So ce726]|uniref:SMI1/KNR4 family protein n=1 Tax=Sorangium sp. So ce726 TaxID=3133319 RepID=UPI003F636EE8
MNAVPVADVAVWLGLDDGNGHVRCPGCGEADKGVAIMGNGLKCQHARCAGKGVRAGARSVVDLVMEVRVVDAKQAVEQLAVRFGFAGFGEGSERRGEGASSALPMCIDPALPTIAVNDRQHRDLIEGARHAVVSSNADRMVRATAALPTSDEPPPLFVRAGRVVGLGADAGAPRLYDLGDARQPVRLHAAGEADTPDDNVHQRVDYTEPGSAYIVKPEFVETTDEQGRVLRRRTATYWPGTGALKTVTNVISGGKRADGTTYANAEATWSYVFDEEEMIIDELRVLFDESPSRLVGRGATDSEIVAAERQLGIKLSGEFREFLKIYGWGGILSVELHGLGSDVPSHLDLVRIAESERGEMSPRLPEHLVPIMNDGGGNIYCLDARFDEPSVVLWDHEAGEDQEPSVEGARFGEWLLAFLKSIQ